MERPTGFSFEQYQQMFALDDAGLQGRILDLGGGFSTFNCQGRAAGYDIVSFDALYELSPAKINDRVDAWCLDLVQQGLACDSELSQAYCADLAERSRQFSQDVQSDQAQGHYLSQWQDIDKLSDSSFSCVVAPYYFFHSVAGSLDDHIDVINVLCRVATELRIFPLLAESGKAPEQLGPLMLALQQQNLALEVVTVDGEMPYGSGAMLRVTSQLCEVKIV